eukprot:358531-Chlamydomonas_euryale.AAC.2
MRWSCAGLGHISLPCEVHTDAPRMRLCMRQTHAQTSTQTRCAVSCMSWLVSSLVANCASGGKRAASEVQDGHSAIYKPIGDVH